MIKPWLLKIVGKTRLYIAINVLASVVGLLANIFIVTKIAETIEQFCIGLYTQADGIRLLQAAVAALLIRVAASFVSARMAFNASNEVKSLLREKIFDKLCALGKGYTDKIGTSEAVQIAGEGVDQLEIYFGSYLPQLFYSVIAPVTLFFVFYPISRKAATVLLVCVPLIPLSIMAVQAVARRLLKEYWGVYANLGEMFLDNVQGLTTLKIYEADETRHREMNRQAEAFRRITMRVLYMQLNSITVMDLVAYGGAAAGIIIAVKSFSAGEISLSGAIMIILLSADFFIPLRQLGSFFHVAMNGMVASEKMKELFDRAEKAEGDEKITDRHLSVAMEDVSFSYDGKRRVLENVSIKADSGEFICLAGQSGCGKSTIASLLMGEKDTYQGKIKIADCDQKQMSEKTLMDNITLLKHNAYLFKGSVRENLLMANKAATDAEMLKVLKKAGIYDFLNQADGLETRLSEGGENISGGQRQRIAMARALLHDTPIYIFDEATSNIDMESEAIIMETIEKMAGEKTVILISHRLMNAKKADRIYMMEKGVIKETGHHEALIEEGGLYCQMYRNQQRLENYGRGGA